MFVAAVTGTNGKTSTVEFVRQILESSGWNAASWGTLGLLTSHGREPNSSIGVGSKALPLLLERLELNEVEGVAIEAFSSSLHTGALAEVRPDVAAFTNFSRDHLEFHESVSEYFNAKQLLFEKLLRPDGTAVLNTDITESETIRSVCVERGIEVCMYGRKSDADIRIVNISPTEGGTDVEITVGGWCYNRTVPVIGAVMVENALCALGIALAAGIGVERAVNSLRHLEPPEGRLDRVAVFEGAEIFVDYAHTPAALEAVLETLRPRVNGRLVIVFGCGGDRDQGKRRLMGKIAETQADIVFVTDDNPRHEDPVTIRADILDGCASGIEVSGRRDAIFQALKELKEGDALVIAGKGHEDYQIVGDEQRPFSDREEVKSLLDETGA